jgi:hypothetical protein
MKLAPDVKYTAHYSAYLQTFLLLINFLAIYGGIIANMCLEMGFGFKTMFLLHMLDFSKRIKEFQIFLMKIHLAVWNVISRVKTGSTGEFNRNSERNIHAREDTVEITSRFHIRS